MAQWWEEPLVFDFGRAAWVSLPRQLYAPDDPDGPSEPNMDVEALKRMLSRGGRWPWPSDPDGAPFDQEYSNAFAYGKAYKTGKPQNAGDSGVAGFQRAIGLPNPSGAVGERTFYAALTARIQKGLPNAGDYYADDRAIDLLRQAEKIYASPNSSSPSADPRQLALDHLERRVGYTEQPAGSNCDERTDGIRTAQDHCAGGETWLRYQPWCGCWAYYALETAGVKRIDSSLASVASIEDYARAGEKCYRGWTTDRAKVDRGDLVVIGGYGVHVETVRGFSGSNTLTYGGNTSAGSSGSQSNGGGAYARTRYPSEVRGYALIDYPA